MMPKVNNGRQADETSLPRGRRGPTLRGRTAIIRDHSIMEARWRETLIFELEGRRFGLPASDVQELVRIVTITPPPPGAGPIEGVINLRGMVVPVFDLRARLGLAPKPVEISESLVIVRRGDRRLAFRVDRPLELATFAMGDVESARVDQVEDHRTPGIAKVAGGLAVLLDLETLLGPVEAGSEGGVRS